MADPKTETTVDPEKEKEKEAGTDVADPKTETTVDPEKETDTASSDTDEPQRKPRPSFNELRKGARKSFQHAKKLKEEAENGK